VKKRGGTGKSSAWRGGETAKQKTTSTRPHNLITMSDQVETKTRRMLGLRLGMSKAHI